MSMTSLEQLHRTSLIFHLRLCASQKNEFISKFLLAMEIRQYIGNYGWPACTNIIGHIKQNQKVVFVLIL